MFPAAQQAQEQHQPVRRLMRRILPQPARSPVDLTGESRNRPPRTKAERTATRLVHEQGLLKDSAFKSVLYAGKYGRSISLKLEENDRDDAGTRTRQRARGDGKQEDADAFLSRHKILVKV